MSVFKTKIIYLMFYTSETHVYVFLYKPKHFSIINCLINTASERRRDTRIEKTTCTYARETHAKVHANTDMLF